MLVLAAMAAAVTPHEPARATARIVRVQRISKDEWERSSRKREIVIHESGQQMLLRLIEFE